MKKKLMYWVIAFLSLGCEKEFLDKKPSSDIIRPQTPEDLERLLDNDRIVNITGVLPRMGSDEYFIPDLGIWQGLFTSTQRNAYIWETDLYEGEKDIADWGKLYTAVFYANSVLEELETMDSGTDARRNAIKGRALFARAWANYDLVNTFAPIYQKQTAATDPGIPLRVTADVNTIKKIASIQSCYDLIISDLFEASELLISNAPGPLKTRASKAACQAMLARVYLTMGEYSLALEGAERSLELYSNVTDFNTLDRETDEPFRENTDDVLYYSTQLLDGNFIMTAGVGPNTADFIGIDTVLLQSFQEGDLRKEIFFGRGTDGRYYRKLMFGNTTNNMYPFTGLATDEIYLVKAECEARLGKTERAKETLLILLNKRLAPGTEIGLENLQGQALINKVLEERRKELVWRSLRWTDLKRLNRDGAYIEIKRDLGQNLIRLAPNSAQYVFPIPDDELIHLK